MAKRYVGARKIFEQHVPSKFIDDWLRLLVKRIKRAKELVSGSMSPEMARDALPHFRRGLIEDLLFHLVGLHGGEAHRMPNASDNSKHTEGIFGPVLLTVHAVRELRELPRYAIFREGLTHESAQGRFYFMEETPSRPDKERPSGVYAQLLYGPVDERTGFPAFARIAFPLPGGRELFTESIDLTARLSQLLYRQIAEEVIGDELQMNLAAPQKVGEEVIGDELQMNLAAPQKVGEEVIGDELQMSVSTQQHDEEIIDDELQMNLFAQKKEGQGEG
ncbi:hypothetical protein JRI60_52215 [Archangium violaceum]|uniref:hypothetical protein n=1 Tax=Archangium violaceum TaxID=83451 RepID=UPI00194E6A75|nr:hypothetical protein [Archangium violaceum]QRN97414.1 hypothetical protein JRI60_52215 [Archangium violaceum]